MIRDMAGAFRFLTILPVKIKPVMEESLQLARSMFYFPLVGLVIGTVSLAVYSLVGPWLPGKTATLLLMLLPLLLSGGIHVDGFGDFCDGFFGGKSREDTLRIMKDPRLGSWGVTGIVFLLLFKLELLHSLPRLVPSFLAAMVLSRWSQVVLSFYLPYGGDGGGLGSSVASRLGKRELAGASLLALPVVLWLGLPGICLFVLLPFFLFVIGAWFKRKVGGITGDLLGAASEMTELFVFLFLTAITQVMV